MFNKTDLYETIGIAISILLASIISVISEYGSEKSFEKLNEDNKIKGEKYVEYLYGKPNWFRRLL